MYGGPHSPITDDRQASGLDCLLVVASLLVTNVSNQVLRPSGLTCTSKRERKGHAQLNDKPCKGLNDNDYDAAYNKGATATDK